MSSPLLILKAVQQFETKTSQEAVTVQCLWRVLWSTTSKSITADSVVLTDLELENQVHCKIHIYYQKHY